MTAIIFLDYLRHDHTPAALKNLLNAGCQFDLFTINRKGIAAAINEGLQKAKDYDHIAIIANDIIMPDNWLRSMVDHAQRLENTGIVGIHCVESLPEVDSNGVRPSWCPFGNWLITKKLFDTIGYFNTKHDPYGMQDSDYGYRATKAGFYNYYLNKERAQHIGDDMGNKNDYRKMKDEGLNKAGAIYSECVSLYNETQNYYLGYEQCFFNKDKS